MIASEDSNDYSPTNLDLIKLDDLESGFGLHSESGKWSVFRYNNDFTVCFEDGRIIDFNNLDSLIKFLSS